MVRVAALAACLLALGATANALSCQTGYLKLEYVGPANNNDPMAKCLTSARIDIDSGCKVTLSSLQGRGTSVPDIWSAAPALNPLQSWKECPDMGKAVQAVQGTGTKLEAVRNAIINAFAGFVYGVDDYDQFNKELEVPDLDFFPGKLHVKRTGLDTLVYAISEATTGADDVKTDFTNEAITEIAGCAALADPGGTNDYTNMCRINEDADKACSMPNSYPVLVVEDAAVNAYNEQGEAFVVCGYCPAGTRGDGRGCSTCPAGTYSDVVGGDCLTCPLGTYSNAGSSYCIPCPAGTYSNNGAGAKECTACPEDSYSWIPGAAACIRCVNGIPTACVDNNCGADPSTPTTHIVSVGAMSSIDANGCGLNQDVATSAYEIKSYSRCNKWGSGLQFAFTVNGDCSIQISPISDPSCSVPTTTTTDAKYQYGALQQRAYYYQNAAGDWRISSLLDTTRDVTKSIMLDVRPNGGNLQASWYPATIDTKEGQTPLFVGTVSPPTNAEVCKATLSVTGGNILGRGADVNTWSTSGSCPAGSFYHKDEICPICPVGFTCAGGGTGANRRVACLPNTYNDVLGSTTCSACPAADGADLKYTSYAAAEQCAVERLNMTCAGNPAISQAFDQAAQACLPCPAGTQRIYSGADASLECQECPIGTSSKEGEFCMDCPAGEYSPSPGLANQDGTLGTQCVECAVGSISLRSGTAEQNPLSQTKAGLCDACPPGTYEENDNCVRCPDNTYRSGDATPENNVCKPIPAGYKYTDAAAGATRDNITWCAPGTVSNYGDVEPTTANAATARIPADGTVCLACTDALLGADLNTYAPRKGMTKCVPCPAGTLPKNDASGATTTCTPCGDGTFRDAYDPVVGDKCTDCGAGFEVGPSSKMACTQCRPGTFLDGSMVTQKKNTCAQCDKNEYRPTFGATSCLPCPRGTQTSDKGNVECTACPIGYYNNKPKSDCVAAPAGTFVNTTGAFITTPCPKGSWNNEQAQDNCNPCAPGKYSNTLGSKECKTCPAGTYSAGQASFCLDCRKGYAAPAGAAACSPCKPGTYAPNTKSATCKLCPKGFQCPTNAMQKEGACPRGTFSNKEGNRLCTPCPVNTMSQGGGVGTGCSNGSPCPVMACTKCPPGTNTRGLVGQSRCQVIRPQVRRLGF